MEKQDNNVTHRKKDEREQVWKLEKVAMELISRKGKGQKTTYNLVCFALPNLPNIISATILLIVGDVKKSYQRQRIAYIMTIDHDYLQSIRVSMESCWHLVIRLCSDFKLNQDQIKSLKMLGRVNRSSLWPCWFTRDARLRLGLMVDVIKFRQLERLTRVSIDLIKFWFNFF